MTTIETLTLLILAVLFVPSLCKSLRRPSLVYCMYILLGVVCAGNVGLQTSHMLQEVGKIGFTLLLFLIGLEIEIPSFAEIKKASPFCLKWFCVQLPILLLFGWLAGFDFGVVFVASAAITACSLSIAYGLVKGQIKEGARTQIVLQMVIIELISLLLLAIADVAYGYGWGSQVLWQISLLLLFLLLIKLISGPIHKQLSRLIDTKKAWEIHYVMLIVFVVAIIGERIGLSSAKTAFFLGLFMHETTRGGIKFEDELNPIAKGILIPVFFVSLGTKIGLQGLLPWVLPISVFITCVLFAVRFLLFSSVYKQSLPAKHVFFYCPNITMAAVGSEILMHHTGYNGAVHVLLITGLIMTLVPVFLFPKPKGNSISLQTIVD